MSQFIPRQFIPPKKQSYFLFGPRGVGKSRLLQLNYLNQSNKSTSLKIDLLNERTLLQFLAQPERLHALVKSLNSGSVVIIDEVQKAPNLLATVHEILESDEFPQLQFILTGSSSRKLKKEGVDLLAGRALVRNLFPFLASELGVKFNFARALKEGLVPVVWDSDSPSDTLDSYIGIYLKEEVKQEGLVRNLESFSRFLNVMCFSHSEIINLSNVARETAIKRSTIDGYMSILEDLLLGYRIPSFKIKNRKQTVESEKFYFFDSGVFNSLLPKGPLVNEKQFIGQAIEGLVAQHLKAWTSYRNQGDEVYFWRTSANTEVDFVLYGPKLFMAIEVKTAREPRLEHLAGLRSFSEDYPSAKCILLHTGKEELLIKNIRCIPIEKFLLSLKV